MSSQAAPQIEQAERSRFRRRNSHARHTDHKCGWKKATCTMIAETLSLGILSLPQAIARVGYAPGLILLVILSLITTGTGYFYYLYKMKYPHIRSVPQALEDIFGQTGRWIADVIILAYLLFLMAGHLILFSAFVQAVSTPDTVPCRAIMILVASLFNIALTFCRNFARLGWAYFLCCVSITLATFVCLGFLAANRTSNLAMSGNFPAFALTPLGLPYSVTGVETVTTLFGACAAFSNILLSYSGSICYFNIIDEMQKPKDFWKCLLITNAVTVSMYLIAGVGMYFLAGQAVDSPALKSAGTTGAKAAYICAIPTILFAAVILANVQSKRTEHVLWASVGKDADQQCRSTFSRASLLWYMIAIGWWCVALVIANCFPFYGTLLAIIGAVSGNWICLGWPAMFMLHCWRPEAMEMDGTVRKMTGREIKETGGWWRHYTATTRLTISALAMILLIVFNLAATGVGLYGAVMEFAEATKGPAGLKPFSCRYDSWPEASTA